jgi:hypothetical protein
LIVQFMKKITIFLLINSYSIRRSHLSQPIKKILTMRFLLAHDLTYMKGYTQHTYKSLIFSQLPM